MKYICEFIFKSAPGLQGRHLKDLFSAFSSGGLLLQRNHFSNFVINLKDTFLFNRFEIGASGLGEHVIYRFFFSIFSSGG